MALYICTNCEYGAASWLGKCPNCGEWNTMVERKEDSSNHTTPTQKITLTPLSKIKTNTKERKKTNIFEFDRVLGSGFAPGEVVLLTGEPGVGKSTLLLQALQHLKAVYISGEESGEQVKDRALRLNIPLDSFSFSNDLQVEGIIEHIINERNKPDLLVIDSIQTVYSKDITSAPGSINQLKETASKLISFAKQEKVAVVLIGHITKEGDTAGPKTLEHLVDCVLHFEGERVSNFRILRAVKNRFGSTEEIGIFEMKEGGLHQVTNPLVFLENQDETVAGKSIVGVSEGKRPLFYEIQTLAVPTVLSIPRRVVKGVDYNKVQILIAVLKKHLSLRLDAFDIYVNVIGGVKITSTLADLGIAVSLYSSIQNIAIPKKTVFIGEVGLLGEVRKGFSEKKIIDESKRLGFKRIYSSANISNIRMIKSSIIP
ncbi:MAG: DNA repair protein RadA [Patescibacteria group bacterium]